MLEVINGVLLVYFLVMCTISALVPYLVKPIAACFSKPSHEYRKALAELGALKEEQKNLSIKEDFAAFSKMQRRINKLEYDLKDNSQERIGKTLAVKASIHVVLQVVIAAAILISVIWFRHEPIVVLKGNLFPLTSTLQYPSGMPNGVSTHVFMIISNISIRQLIKPILS